MRENNFPLTVHKSLATKGMRSKNKGSALAVKGKWGNAMGVSAAVLPSNRLIWHRSALQSGADLSDSDNVNDMTAENPSRAEGKEG